MPPPAAGSSHAVRISLDRKSSNTSSYARPDFSQMNSFNSYPPPPRNPLDDIEHLRSRDGRRPSGTGQSHRDIGFSASGVPMTDGPIGTSVLRQRTNRLDSGAGAGGRFSPDASSIKLGMDPKFDRYSSDLGPGLQSAHEIEMGMETHVVGPRGIKMVELEPEGDEDSPYPEVRASVSNVDDTDIPANTVRMWVLGIVLMTLATAINDILSLRYPAPTLTALLLEVMAYPLGKLLAATLPMRTFTSPRWLGGFQWSLNPGMFNIKEHTAIVLMANIALVPAYALNTILALDSGYFYNDPKPLGWSILLVMSSQMIGFGLAGLTRRFLVTPGSMIWPQVLVFASVFNMLYAEEDSVYDTSISRFRYFIYVSVGAFLWWFLPGYVFTALSSFSFICWIWPNSEVVNTLFGTATGIGMSFLTFDWQTISYLMSPLVVPWWAQCNIFVGCIIFLWILAPALWFSNVLNFGYMPFNSSGAFDRFGESYNVTAVLDENRAWNEEAYASYSRLYFGTTYFIVYWCGFATFTCVLVHAGLHHGKAIWRGVRGIKTEEDDVHAKLMRKYRDHPDWWYGAVFVFAVVIGIICAEVYDTGLPIWGFLVSILIPLIYFLPSGFIYAQTSQTIGVNLISEFIAGYAFPGQALPNMMIKLYSQVGLTQGLTYAQGFKLAHYMKLSPRMAFSVSFVAAVWSSIVHVFVNLFMRTHVNDICSSTQANSFECPSASVYYTSSIIWGIIGPERMFANGSYYSSAYWAMLIGALTPIPVFLLARRFPSSVLKIVSTPLIFLATSVSPPASGIVISSWFLLGYIFQCVIRKRNFRWWTRYNFVTSAAMDTGTVITSLVIFLCLVLPKGGTISLDWWGNSITGNTLDGQGLSRLIPPTDGFAPPPSAIS